MTAPEVTPELPAAELLRQHFDEAFSAPDGIKRLRELILTLAMQGKLVPQDPSEGTAAELLEQIAAEKKRLVKEGKIKAPKALPAVEDAEQPYDLPQGWAWVRLGDVGVWAIGSGFPHAIQGEQGLDVKLCKVSDMNIAGNEKYIVSTNNSISKETAVKSKINVHGERTIIFPKIGGAIATNKRRIILESTAIDNNCLGIRIWEEIDLEWAYKYLSGIDMQQYQVGTSVPALSQSTLEQIPTPLPPLAEQRRIVARIDQLMARCDELEALREQQEQKRVQVHRAVLREVTAASDPAAFAEGWRFLADHFGELHATPKDLAELRGAILQLAVMGKLVPQDPSEGTAAELLEQIQAEKKRLLQEGKIKAPKPLPSVTEAEQPYQVPQGWAWVRLGEVAQKIHYGFTASADFTKKDVRLLRITDIQENTVNWESVPGCVIEDRVAEAYLLANNDILIARTGGTIGKTYLVQGINVKAVFASYLIRVVPSSEIEANYLKDYMETSLYWGQLYAASSGTGQPNVNGTSLSSLLLPLPPLAEQRRIVAKVDQLMGLCDVLEERITAQGVKQGQLLGAVMAQLAPTLPASRPAAAVGGGRRGRPRKAASEVSADGSQPAKRGRGRPRKAATKVEAAAQPAVKRRPGRPRKDGGIPSAGSAEEAAQMLDAMRAQDSGHQRANQQVSLFDEE